MGTGLQAHPKSQSASQPLRGSPGLHLLPSQSHRHGNPAPRESQTRVLRVQRSSPTWSHQPWTLCSALQELQQSDESVGDTAVLASRSGICPLKAAGEGGRCGCCGWKAHSATESPGGCGSSFPGCYCWGREGTPGHTSLETEYLSVTLPC